METSFGAGLLYVLCLHTGRCAGVLADRETHEQTAEPREGSGKGFRTAEEDLRKPGEVLKNATLNLPEGKMTFDVVLMDKRGVYLVRTYGWGIKIYGTPDGAMWRREDAKRKEEFENPLLELKKRRGGDHKGDGRKRSSEPEGDADGRIRGQLPDSGAVSRIWFFLHNVSGIKELV